MGKHECKSRFCIRSRPQSEVDFKWQLFYCGTSREKKQLLMKKLQMTGIFRAGLFEMTACKNVDVKSDLFLSGIYLIRIINLAHSGLIQT